MLAVPYAFKLAGWSALPIFVVMAVVFTYTAYVHTRTASAVAGARLLACAR